MLPSSRLSSPSAARNRSRTAAPTIIGRSSSSVCDRSFSGCRSATKPRIKSRLSVFVPAMFPTASEPLPRWAASIPIASSGALVPMATIVTPMTIGEIPSRAAIRVPPRTMSSAPPITASRPMTNTPNSNMRRAYLTLEGGRWTFAGAGQAPTSPHNRRQPFAT